MSQTTMSATERLRQLARGKVATISSVDPQSLAEQDSAETPGKKHRPGFFFSDDEVALVSESVDEPSSEAAEPEKIAQSAPERKPTPLERLRAMASGRPLQDVLSESDSKAKEEEEAKQEGHQQEEGGPQEENRAEERAEQVPPKSAFDRLREVAKQDEAEEQSAANFRRSMASLRALGRLMEAVYFRPGAGAPEPDRIHALRQLAVVSRSLANQLLEIIGERSGSGYARAMAMDAVIDLVARTWEERDRDNPSQQWLSEQPLKLIQAAAVDPQIVRAAEELAQKTWTPVRTQEQYRDALALAAHKSFWRLYLLGERVPGMTEERCQAIVLRLTQYLMYYPQPRGDNPDMRTSWVVASMGRLTGLVCAELRGRVAARGPEWEPGEKDFQEVVDVAIQGFEGIEKHASRLLESGDALFERVADRPGAVC